jgi:hypothetical protein
MGRRSYEIMRPHWAASDEPIATAMNEKPKAVFDADCIELERARVLDAPGGTHLRYRLRHGA